MERVHDMIESVAVGAATACLAHCLALPTLIAFLPAIATAVPLPAHLHLALLAFAIPTTGMALWAGHRRHRSAAPLLAGAAGLALLALGVLAWGETPREVPATVAGSLLIAAAHLANWRGRRAVQSKL